MEIVGTGDVAVGTAQFPSARFLQVSRLRVQEQIVEFLEEWLHLGEVTGRDCQGNLLSLEQYQYIAGPGYNANYTGSLPEMWMSVDPVIMDANLVQLLNKARAANGFAQLPEVPEFILYSIQLGLGRGIPSETRFISIDEENP